MMMCKDKVYDDNDVDDVYDDDGDSDDVYDNDGDSTRTLNIQTNHHRLHQKALRVTCVPPLFVSLCVTELCWPTP